MLAARKVYHDGASPADVAREKGLAEDVLKKWVEYLKPGNEVRHHLLEWQNAGPEKLTETATTYQRRFQQRFAEWIGALSQWRPQYQEAINEDAKSLPDKPQFEAGEDRFFAEVYFEKDGPFTVSEKDQTKFSTEQWARLAQLKQDLEELKKSCAGGAGDGLRDRGWRKGHSESLHSRRL